MGDFTDMYSDLPSVIDVGGIRYYMLPGKPIQDVYRSRDEYLRTFGDDPNVERVLRQYMGFSLQSKKRLKFEDPADKQLLISILKKRAAQLKASEEFSSSVLKNTIFQRSYLNIQTIIGSLSGTGTTNVVVKPPESDKCVKNKTTVKEIPEDRLFFILLEIAWYLLHPDMVPKDIQCKWAELIQDLDTVRLRTIVEGIKSDISTTDSNTKPVNYFSKVGLNIVKKPTFTNALEMVQEYINNMDGEDANDAMKKRLEILLNVLKMKKYLDDSSSPINSIAGKKLSNSLITNPMRGGAGKTIDRPLGQAMIPFFDYFKVVFDPIYSFLDSTLGARVPKDGIKSATIPQLVTLLHICNNLKPSATASIDSNTYGVYRITNVGNDILDFFREMLGATAGYLDNKLPDESNKKQFGEQLFKLPKVRLTSLIDGDPLYGDPITIPYTRFLVLDSNFSLKDGVEGAEADALKDFFKPDDLYIVCTNSKKYDSINIEIPMNFYGINFEEVDVTLPGLPKIDIIDSVFSSKSTNGVEAAGGAGSTKYFLENYVDLKPDVVYNEAELALSIFILFKQLMPK
jgi:hypothetical protein